MKIKLHHHMTALVLAVLLAVNGLLLVASAQGASPDAESAGETGTSSSVGAPGSDRESTEDEETPPPDRDSSEGTDVTNSNPLGMQPDDAAEAPVSAVAYALPDISVRVEYTDSFGGPYNADYEFRSNEGGGDIIIFNPNTEPGNWYKIWVTVEGYGETLGTEGPIEQIVNRGSFNVSGGSNNPNNPGGTLLLGFQVSVIYEPSPIPDEDLDLYYKVTGRVFQRNVPEHSPAELPFTYRPEDLDRHDRPQISMFLEDGTEFPELGSVAPDGTFVMYLNKAVIDALSENAWLRFELRSPYATHEPTHIMPEQIKDDMWPLVLFSDMAGIIEGTITRGHLPAGTSEDATAYTIVHLTPEGQSSVVSMSVGISLNKAGDQINYRVGSIPAGSYYIDFTHTHTLWEGTPFQYYNGKSDLESADLVTVHAFRDTSNINTLSWPGDRDHGGTGDVSAPIVENVSPVSKAQNPSGSLTITFNERVAEEPKGMVRLVAAAEGVADVTLEEGAWSDDGQTYTVPYQGLESGRHYYVEISGFADEAGNIMAENRAYSLVVIGGEVDRVFEHEDSGISLQGEFTPDTKVNVLEGIVAFNEHAMEEARSAIHEADETGQLLFVGDISVDGGRYSGTLTLTIPIGLQYNGQTVYVLHCTQTQFEIIPAIVKDGMVTVELTSLSPVAVVSGLGGVPTISGASYTDLHAGGMTATFDLDTAANVYATTRPADSLTKPSAAEIKAEATPAAMQSGTGLSYDLSAAQPDTEYIAYLVAESAENAGVFSEITEIPFKTLQRISAAAILGVSSPVVGAAPSTAISGGTGFSASLAWNGSPAEFAADTPYTATITLTAEDGYSFSDGYETTEQIAAFTVNGVAPILVSNARPYRTLVFTTTFPKANEPLPAPTVQIQSIHNIYSTHASMNIYVSQPSTIHWVALTAGSDVPITAEQLKNTPGVNSVEKRGGYQHVPISGLTPSTSYVLYLVAENAEGKLSSIAVSSPFSTPGPQSSDTSLLSVAGQEIPDFGGGDGSGPQQAKTAGITVPYTQDRIVYDDDLVLAPGASSGDYDSSNQDAVQEQSMRLAVGSNDLILVVVAEDGLARCHYRIEITREPAPLQITGGADRSSSGGSSTADSARLPAATPRERWLDAASLAADIAEAVANQRSFVRTRHDGRTVVRKESFAALAKAGLAFEHDTMANRAVQVRLGIADPGKVQEDLYLSAWVESEETERVRSTFERWFSNKTHIIHLDHPGAFGQPAAVAAKMDLDDLDVDDLVFYRYHRESNSYIRLPEPNGWIDANGYLHFTTPSGGSIVVSEGPLTKK